MTRHLYALMAGVLLVGLHASLEAQGRGNSSRKAVADVEVEHTSARTDVHVVFSSRDVEIIREYYRPRYRNLPRGLQKKLARTGQLPPGWQKKMEPFPVELERRMVALPSGYQRGVFDGHAVIYKPGTSIVIDATILF